jgi:adenylate cyclase
VSEQVRRGLLERGVTPDEIERATEDGTIHILVAERMLVPEDGTFTSAELSAVTGIPLELDERLWRAMGFPVVPADEQAFTAADRRALAGVRGLLDLGMVTEDGVVQLTRVIGSSMARIAEAEVDASPALRGEVSSEELAELYIAGADRIFADIALLLEYVWRRHLQAALRQSAVRRRDAAGAGTVDMAVGLADLVGFTALSQQLSEEALATMVGRFEELAYETVAQLGGRVVKMIGDEVMFTCKGAEDAAAIALALSAVYAEDELLSDVRVGLAVGPVLLREGDCYGPTVNRAHRIVGIAAPGSVLVDPEVHRRLVDQARFRWKSLRPRYLKDIGRVPLWVLMPVSSRAGDRGRPLGLVTEAVREQVERAHAIGRELVEQDRTEARSSQSDDGASDDGASDDGASDDGASDDGAADDGR